MSYDDVSAAGRGGQWRQKVGESLEWGKHKQYVYKHTCIYLQGQKKGKRKKERQKASVPRQRRQLLSNLPHLRARGASART